MSGCYALYFDWIWSIESHVRVEVLGITLISGVYKERGDNIDT